MTLKNDFFFICGYFLQIFSHNSLPLSWETILGDHRFWICFSVVCKTFPFEIFFSSLDSFQEIIPGPETYEEHTLTIEIWNWKVLKFWKSVFLSFWKKKFWKKWQRCFSSNFLSKLQPFSRPQNLKNFYLPIKIYFNLGRVPSSIFWIFWNFEAVIGIKKALPCWKKNLGGKIATGDKTYIFGI